MKNFKLLVVLILSISTFVFISCQKDNQNNNKQQIKIPGRMSLNEFKNSLITPDEHYFFQNTNITDNTSVAKKLIKEKTTKKTLSEAKIKVKFKWGKSCVRSIGVCLIIPIDKKQSYSKQISTGNAEGYLFDNKYIIIPLTDDNGLTSDGYLPLYDDIAVDSSTTIKAGIYKAYYDSIQKKYIIALDLK